MIIFYTIFIKLYVSENPKGIRVIVGSMNMGYYIYRTHDLFCSKCVPIPTVLIECMIEFRSGRFGENGRNERLEIRGDGHRSVMFLDFLHLPCPGDNGHFYIASDRRQNHRDGLASTELSGLKTNTPSAISIISTVQTHLRSFVLNIGISNSRAMNLSAIFVQSYFYSGSV